MAFAEEKEDMKIFTDRLNLSCCKNLSFLFQIFATAKRQVVLGPTFSRLVLDEDLSPGPQ